MRIDYDICRLDNGLTVLVHKDPSTPLVAVNMLYNVGSKDEDTAMTGFAHLFEHLMFGGTLDVQSFDGILQRAGGESNAFTNTDYTNYYITIPAVNIETALWLESDRMKGPNLTDTNIDIQKKVVTEEYRQRYINQPYGDAMLHLRPLTYKVHPYRWATIGMDISHIEKADYNCLRSFFNDHYSPGNAILTIAGNIGKKKAVRLATKWFDDIPPRHTPVRQLPAEPERTSPSTLVLERNVPANAIYRAWIIPGRAEPSFHAFDVITDILAGGVSGRLFTILVREKRLFSEINSFVTDELDKGMLMVVGRVTEGISPELAVEALDDVFARLAATPPSAKEMQKVRNRNESLFHIAHTSILQKAIALSQFSLMGTPEAINSQVKAYSSVAPETISEKTAEVLIPQTAATLWYRKAQK